VKILDEPIEKYIKNCSPYFDGVLGEIQKESTDKNIPIVPPEIARFMATLMSMKRPEKILEIGCAVGFSTALMCRYLRDDGKITTIERHSGMIQNAKLNFKRLQIEDKVILLEGDAIDILPAIKERYDVIFLDSAKGQYLHLLPFCLKLLNVGGIFLVDDVLQKGRTVQDTADVVKRQRTIHKRMNLFISEVINNPALESSIVPLDDGMLVATKTKEIEGVYEY